MQESKLIKSLQNLDGKTKERFRQFVLSPYFNQHKATISLLNYLLKNLNKKGRQLDRHRVFTHLFPDLDYNEQSLHNVMSSLKKLYHKFWAYEQIEKETFLEASLLLDSSFESNQFDLLRNRGKLLQRQLTQYPHKDDYYYLAQFKYNRALGYYNALYRDRSKELMLQSMMDYLDKYYMLEMFKNGCHLTANMLMMNTSFDLEPLDLLVARYQSAPEKYKNEPSINLYYTILMTLKESDNPKHYQALKAWLQNDTDQFNVKEQSELYSFANNYCVRRINQGDNSFQLELFDLYKEGIKTGLIMDNGLISEWNYKNITVLGSTLKEFEWTETFLENYKDKLATHRRENVYNYNLAHLYYSKKRFSEALDHLLLVEFSDVKYHLNYNSLLLATYYELGDWEALLSLIDTFRIYVIRNKKITVEQKRSYTNFLRFAKKLTNIKQLPKNYGKISKEEKIANLYQKIQQTNSLMNSNWLEKICRMEAKEHIEQLDASTIND